MSASDLARVAEACVGMKTVLASGVFDVLHSGHEELLRFAKELGEYLVVSINSDRSARALGKGPGRPVNRAKKRAAALLRLGTVDAVVVFDQATPEKVIEALRPTIYVKGGDYAAQSLPEGPSVTRNGGQIVIFPRIEGLSSSSLITSPDL